jgi:hypothetical protein
MKYHEPFYLSWLQHTFYTSFSKLHKRAITRCTKNLQVIEWLCSSLCLQLPEIFLFFWVWFLLGEYEKSAGARSDEYGGWLISATSRFGRKPFAVVEETAAALSCKRNQLHFSRTCGFTLAMRFNSSSSLHVEFTHHRIFLQPQVFCGSDAVYKKSNTLYFKPWLMKADILDFGEDSVLRSMLWRFVSGMYRNTERSSSAQIQKRKCEFAWHFWIESPHVVAQYCFADPRNLSIVHAYFLLCKIVKKNPTKSAIYCWFFIIFKISGHLLKKFCMCFRTWSSWRSPTTWIVLKSSHPALNHLNHSKICVRDTVSFL